MMKSDKVFFWNAYRVSLTNRDEPIFICASSLASAIHKAETLIDQWDDKYKYSIISITYVSPCLI